MLIDTSATMKFVWSKTWLPLIAFLAVGLGVPAIHSLHSLDHIALPSTFTAALGTALAVFLAFRNSSGYDRWWEARKLWGGLVNASRTWARQTLTLIESDEEADADKVIRLQRDLILRMIAYVNALRYHLRKQHDRYPNLARWLTVEEVNALEGSSNVPMRLVETQAELIAKAAKDGLLSDYRRVHLDATLTELLSIQGGCERIKNTKMPRHYDFFPRLFLWVYVFMLPASLVSEVEWMAPVLTVPLSLLFHVLEVSGRYIEDPFENRPTDTQMTSISGSIETNLRELLGDMEFDVEASILDGCEY